MVVNGEVTLGFDDAGHGTPIVGLHGLTATRRYVLMGSRALERAGHRMVLYDARGHGHSSPGHAYDYAQLEGDLRALLDGLGIDRAVLAGASMGAHTALRFALHHPDRVIALALITPAYLPGAHPAGLERWDALARGLREGGTDGFIAAYDMAAVSPRWRDVLTTVLRQRIDAHDHPRAVADALEAVPRSRPFESLEGLAAISAPTLIVGSRDEPDPAHPLSTAQQYAEAIPAARLVVEEDGQSPLAWQGGQLSRLIGDLARQSESKGGRLL